MVGMFGGGSGQIGEDSEESGIGNEADEDQVHFAVVVVILEIEGCSIPCTWFSFRPPSSLLPRSNVC